MTATNIIESAKNKNFHITLLEGNKKLWKKLLLSWGGRCNVTTGIFDKKILKEKYTRGFDFFENFLMKFSPKKCKKWFENHNLSLKIEEDLRVFPTSNNSNDVLWVFENIFNNSQELIDIKYQHKVKKVEKENNQFLVFTENERFEADILVVATGGNAYAHTGSQGDGYSFARSFGHTITQLWPSLSSFLVEENFIKELTGLVFSHAEIIYNNKKISGSLLFTHFGISWPLAFMLSSHLAWEEIKNTKITFKPLSGMNFENWNTYLTQYFHQFPKRKIFSVLKEKLPIKFSHIFIENFIPWLSEKFIGEISKKDREKIAKLLGVGLEITLLERRPWDEFVTAWWVSTDELSPETLESKKINNLYFAWEILNIDGYTGGFSLQICWSTGFIVGQSIAHNL